MRFKNSLLWVARLYTRLESEVKTTRIIDKRWKCCWWSRRERPANGIQNVYLGDGCWLERLVVNVRLNAPDDNIWNVVLVKLEQTVEEFLRLGQQTLARLPVIILLLSRLSQTTHKSVVFIAGAAPGLIPSQRGRDYHGKMNCSVTLAQYGGRYIMWYPDNRLTSRCAYASR